MIFGASEFVFKVPEVVSRARRVLIKPSAAYPAPYPVTTSPGILNKVIAGIREVSDADILILEGTPGGGPVAPIYQALDYNFPRVLTVDAKDFILVEVDNPLLKPFVIPSFWVPNIVLSSDYLISVSPMKIIKGRGILSVMNMLSVLPSSKYRTEATGGWGSLYSLGIGRVLADLYFTLPFDLGIIEAKQVFRSKGDPTDGEIESYGKIFVGEPYEVDREAAEAFGLKEEYLDLIRTAKAGPNP